MKRFFFYAVTLFTVVSMSSYSCKQNGQQTPGNNNNDTSKTGQLPPVETNPPNTPEFKPAFAGQTRIAGVKTQTPLDIAVITEGLGRPWAIINLPDGRFLTTEKSGFMQIVSQDGKTVSKVTGFAPVDDRGQGGMLEVALDPDFATNKTIYWAYSDKKNDQNTTVLAKGVLSADEKTIQNPTVIFTVNPYLSNSNLHYGCRLVFDKNGYLFMCMGERSVIPGRMQAQDLKSGLGKIFRLTKEGKAAPGNPFINTPNALPEIYSYGHRSPQGLDLHPVTGDLWETEMGPKGGDEVNLIVAGKDYGWPTITYGIEYSGQKIGDAITQKAGMEQPVYYWEPSSSPSGSSFYKSNTIPEWQNNFFVGMLSGQHIARLVIENNKVVGEERLLEDMKERIRDVVEGNDGALYAVTDSGKIIRIRKK